MKSTKNFRFLLENIKVEVIIMTSYEFEKAAKNAVIQTLSDDISIDQWILCGLHMS